MSPRFFFPLGLLALAGCAAPSKISAPPAPVSVASLPHHRQKAEAMRRAQAVLLAPAPTLAELDPSASALFVAPPPGSLAANYLTFLKGAPPKRSLLVLEPQAGQDPFYAGCARWMKLYGSGSIAFDSGTTWGMANDVRIARGWDSLALERGRAVQLARALDVSAVAIGEVQNGALRYEVLDVFHVPSRVVGTFSVGGTPAHIAAGLPRLTRQIVGAAGAPNAAIPARVELSPADLAFLGSLPARPDQLSTLPGAKRAHLTRLAGVPLGAVYVGRASLDKKAQAQSARALLSLAPTNSLACAEAAVRFPGVETARRTAAMHALDAKFPRNLCVALGSEALRGQEEDYFAQVHYAELAVRLAPDCPFAWYELAGALGNQADQKRQGKYYGDMTRDEKIEVEKLYPRAQAAAWKATQLEPGDTDYWTRLSNASTFAGDDQWARAALVEALRLDPHNEEALNWGLEIFQPKWFGDNASFARMARIAVENSRRENLDVPDLRDGLNKTNQQSLKLPLLRILVKNEPRNILALTEYSYTLRMETGDSKVSLPFARRAVALAPNSTSALEELADIEQHDMGLYDQAAAHFRRACEINPKQGVEWVNLALALAKGGHKDEARAMAIKGHALGYNGPHPAWKMVGLAPDGSTLAPAEKAKAASE